MNTNEATGRSVAQNANFHHAQPRIDQRVSNSYTHNAGGGRSHSSNRGASAAAAASISPIHQNSGVPPGYVPAYLPGSASLVEELDQKILIVLRDGKHLIGTLCSYDQYSNLVLEGACERRMATVSGVTSHTDIPLGIYIVRGDSVVMMGSIMDPNTTSSSSRSTVATGLMQAVSLDELTQLESKRETPLQWDFDTDLIA